MQENYFDECFSDCPLAMAYVPWQKFEKINDNLDEAYHKGTVFPELDQPFTGRRCV